MADIYETYLHALRGERSEKSELTDRGALEALLRAAAGAVDSKIRVVHEAKALSDLGRPDFKVVKAGMILGYVENKAIGVNLDESLKSQQITRYKQLSGNILLTDYLQFIWIRDGKVAARESIAFPHDLEGKPKKPREDRVAAVSGLLRGFFSTAPEGIARAEQLALALATRSHFLRDFLERELKRQEKEPGRLYGLYDFFREQVIHEITMGEFADAFAQMLAYGLFLARLNASGDVTLANAKQFIPGSFALIRELVQFLDELDAPEYAEIRWVIEEILSIVNGLDLAGIHDDLSFSHRKAVHRKFRAKDEEEHRLFERDPFIYFYEDFLGKYDAKMKKSRGVYYTPPPVVNFIVRAVDDILKDTFGIADGLADHKRVTVLDFACGTGTFLLETFERIFENIGGPEAGKASLIVREHMLKNVYGFEYLIAPYTIAHLKLSQYLADKGHPLKGKERLQVFLTNTLEPIEPQRNLLLPAVSAEVEAAQKVKEKPILVITGNPPYSGHSKNKGAWISSAIDEYKFVYERANGDQEIRKPLGERNSKWLQDDYVKFLRFAQMKMDCVDEGIVAVVTNHSWLDNPTFRGMRQNLMRTFEQIYVLDLHGNAKKKERAQDGSEDKNIFDIEQGVAVSIFIKRKNLPRGIFRGDMYGKRIDKYEKLARSNVKTIEFRQIDPNSANLEFIYKNINSDYNYSQAWPLNKIFVIGGAGVVTAHDAFSIAFSTEELERKFSKFKSARGDRAALHEKFAVEYKEGWDILRGWKALQESERRMLDYIRPIEFTPFDTRKIFLEDNLVWRPVRRIMDELEGGNFALLCSRVTKDEASVFVSEHPFRHKSATRYDITYGYPIYIGNKKSENISKEFRDYIDLLYKDHCALESIVAYIYAILHAPTYRARYAEFLRIDFPRIPFPEKREHFDALAALGAYLIQAHLLRKVPDAKLARYFGQGDHEVEFVKYSTQDQSVAINKTQCFRPVPAPVWEFHIGGYQVIDKYLKSRKGRKLSLDEIDHVARVASSLAFTIDQMQKIDAAYLAAFP